MADPLPSGGPAMVWVTPLADYHNREPLLRIFRKVEFNYFPGVRQTLSGLGAGGRSGVAAGAGHLGARHIGQSVGPPSGSTISPVTANPNRS